MTTASEKFYDRLYFLYPVIDLFLSPQKKKLFGKVNAVPYGRLLEIGVGNGSHLKFYKSHAVIGVDASENMLSRARKHVQDKIQLLRMNGEQLLFPNGSFDYVILSHVIAVVDDPEKLLEEVYRVLKPNGKVFILNHFTPDNCLRYADRFFQRFSKLLHVRSVFHLSSIQAMTKFELIEQHDVGLFSYFKILIYEKKH